MLIPHLHIAGDCGQAIELYQRAFGTKTETVFWDEDLGGGRRVAHAEMSIHGQTVFLNDRFGNPEKGRTCAVHLIVTFRSAGELLACYDVLKEGSTPIDPLERLPYSELAVQFIDRFGVQWGFMVAKD